MEHLTGEEADNRLEEWWGTVADPTHPNQAVVKVIHLSHPSAPFFDELPACQEWRRSHDVPAALAQLMVDTEVRSYLANAEAAHANDATITRVLIVPKSALNDPNSYQRFWLEVHGPFFAAMCHEEVLLLLENQVLDAGIVLRDFDVNIWGNNGVLRTFYGPDGNIAAREFLPWLSEIIGDIAYIVSVVKLARRIRYRILPAKLPIAPSAPALCPSVHQSPGSPGLSTRYGSSRYRKYPGLIPVFSLCPRGYGGTSLE